MRGHWVNLNDTAITIHRIRVRDVEPGDIIRWRIDSGPRPGWSVWIEVREVKRAAGNIWFAYDDHQSLPRVSDKLLPLDLVEIQVETPLRTATFESEQTED